MHPAAACCFRWRAAFAMQPLCSRHQNTMRRNYIQALLLSVCQAHPKHSEWNRLKYILKSTRKCKKYRERRLFGPVTQWLRPFLGICPTSVHMFTLQIFRLVLCMYKTRIPIQGLSICRPRISSHTAVNSVELTGELSFTSNSHKTISFGIVQYQLVAPT